MKQYCIKNNKTQKKKLYKKKFNSLIIIMVKKKKINEHFIDCYKNIQCLYILLYKNYILCLDLFRKINIIKFQVI
jgi:hypothetical protein